jgi:hypothetical protein
MSDADEGSQLAKRRRIARACDQCRHGKLRCDGRSPRCTKCLETKKPCSYGAAAKRRGLKTGYVRALESLWGLVLQKIDGSETAIESLLSRASVLDFRVRDQNGDSTSGPDSLLASWKASKIPEKINHLLASTEDSEDESNTLPLETARELDDHRPVISWKSYAQQRKGQTNILQTARNPAETDFVELSETSLRGDEMRVTTGCDNTSVLLGQPTLPHVLKLPSASSRLLDWYFTYTHSWLPIVERHVVFRTLFSYPAGGSITSRQSSDSGQHAVLWAILACASVEQAQTEATPTSLAQSTQSSEFFYACARNLIPWENEHGYSLGHVQALTILAVYRWVIQDYKAAWSLIAHAISVAVAINLDQIASTWQVQKFPADRVWLGCFVVESLLAMRLRRAPYLKLQNVGRCLPIDESGMEEWEPWRPHRSHSGAEPSLPLRTLSTFNQLVRLVCVANNSLHSAPGNACLQHATSLNSWTEQLPDHCKQAGFQSGRNDTALILTPNIVNLGFVYMSLAIRLCVNPSSHQDERTALGEYAELINQFCNSDASERLPPSWEILANAASVSEDFPIQSREANLRQLQQDLTRLGFSSSGTRSKMPTSSDDVLHPYDGPELSSVIDPDTNTIFVSRTNPAAERDIISVVRERSGNAGHPFSQKGGDISGVANSTRISTTRQQESIMRPVNSTHRSPSSALDIPQRSSQPAPIVQQQFPHETIPAEDKNLPPEPIASATAQATDFINTETLPTMTEEDPFLDYFELFDDEEMFVLLSRQCHCCVDANSCCRQNQSHFMKALGYNV